MEQPVDLAIFLQLDDWNTSLWGSFSSPFLEFPSAKVRSYGMGLLAHEMLHKQSIFGGFIGHDEIDDALNAVGAPVPIGGQDPRSSRIAQICPINP